MVGTGPADRVLRFSPFDLNLDAGELRKSGITLELRPQATKVLVPLVTRPGEMVTREQIKERIWGSAMFVDFEYGLKGAFAEAIVEFQRAATLSPNVTDYKGGLGYAYARAGKRAEARKVLDELRGDRSKGTSPGTTSLRSMPGWMRRIKLSLAWKRLMRSASKDWPS